MRQIEFRGYSLYQKKFVFGDLVHETKETCIRANQTIEVQGSGDAKNSIITYVVKPETIGQYTGLKDKNGTKIFEGDIIGRKGYFNRVIVFHKNGFHTYSVNNPEILSTLSLDEYDFVIGNIHENPELLK